MEAEQLKPTELTKDMIHTMRTKKESSTKYHGTLQILSIKEDQSFMTLSDGHSFQEVALFKSVRPRVVDLGLKPLDIVYPTLFLHKETIDVLADLRVVYQEVGVKIGEPIPYVNYVERDCINPNGDSAIPRRFWEVKKPRATNDSSMLLEPTEGNTQILRVIDPEDVQKINSLTAGTTDFIIKAKVLYKSNKREYDQGKNKATLFGAKLADETDEIHATFFSTACEKYFDKLEVGKTYLFAHGEARKGTKYNLCKNPYEITFSSKTRIDEVDGTGFQVAEKYNFKKVGDVQREQLYNTIDLCAVVGTLGESKSLTLKTGENKLKTSLKVKDDSNLEIELTLWGEYPELQQVREDDVVIFTNLQVSEFNKNRVLNSKQNLTKIIVSPKLTISRVAEVTQWKSGGQEAVRSLNPEKKYRDTTMITIDQLKRETSGHLTDEIQKQQFFVTGYITSCGPTFTYLKCPLADCFKKATVEDNNGNRSTSCPNHGTIDGAPIPRYIGNVRITDHTDSMYLNYTSDLVGQKIFGIDAQKILSLSGDKEGLERYLNPRKHMKFTYRVTCKRDDYGAQERVKYQIQDCYDQVGKRLEIENKTMLHTLKCLQENLF